MNQGAYLVRGGVEHADAFVSHLEKLGVRIRGERDSYVRAYDSFGIKEAHALREKLMLRAFANGGRVFVIATPSMTGEAQNALLKILEEPPQETRLFILTPAPETLLPTLRSRMQSYAFEGNFAESVIDPRAFLKAGSAERLEMLKVFFPKKKGGDDEEGEEGSESKRDTSGAIHFLSALECALSHVSLEHTLPAREGVRAVYRARAYLTDKGSLLKSLLEQVALLVPRV